MSRSIGLNETLTEYLRTMNPDEPAALQRCREETATRGDARMQISPEQGAFMAFLETGVGHASRTRSILAPTPWSLRTRCS